MKHDTPMRIAFCGTPEFAAIVLEEMTKKGVSPALVITNPDRPSGRGNAMKTPPVKEVAESHQLDVMQVEKLQMAKDALVSLNPDILLVCAFGQLIPKEILDIPSTGCVNIHPSLLPKFRGASPIQGALLAGEEKTGVSVMLMDEQLDHGPILAQEEVDIDPKDTQETLARKLALLSVPVCVEAMQKFYKGEITPVPQKDEMATFTKTISKEDGRVDWNLSAVEIERQVRAFNPWPTSWSMYTNKEGKELVFKIWKADVLEHNHTFPDGEPGKIFLGTNDTLAVKANKNFLVIKELQLEGGVRMSSKEFLLGHHHCIGTILH